MWKPPPLDDQLRSVPESLKVKLDLYEQGVKCGHRKINIGSLCHKAAEEITRLKKDTPQQ